MTRVLHSMMLVVAITLTFGVFSIQAHSKELAQPEHLLVLHSYDPSYPWTADAQRGIEDTLAASQHHFRLSLEYLDAKRINDQDYFASASDYFKKKYHNYHFDGIIVTDDTALSFLNSLNLNNLKHLPTVAVGIGDPDASLAATTDNGVIIRTESHLQQNIDLIVRLQPNIRHLYYLADDSLSSRFMRDSILQVLSDYPAIALVEVAKQPLKETQDFLQNISPDDAVLLGLFNTSLGNNIYYEYKSIAHAIGEVSSAPVFVLWEFYITHGVLGGYVTRSYELGVKAVDLVSEKLVAASVQSSHTINTSAAMFDYQAMEKHNIDVGLLPENALVIGQPQSFWSKNRYLLLVAGAVTFSLLSVILVLSVLLSRKRKISQQDRQIVALQKKTLKAQENLINVLGQAIESRSGETGNHVKRVATISARLANLINLPKEQCELIETISPMHDVGKISIPESILDKPGDLNDEEWAVMKSHAYQGFKLLSSGEGELLEHAAVIALEHHERWDGEGYPDGKAGEQIHILARITTIADVFDALLSKRSYKQTWPADQVRHFFSEQRGKQFDPQLTDLLLDNLDEFLAIRARYPDC